MATRSQELRTALGLLVTVIIVGGVLLVAVSMHT